ncbi:hypothetical protein [Streptomyces sp. GC420]|uniref:hypothetical protein n=1 Tax=Streptomyces sp. GC420 TaxID=2697568 RepID=UPI001414D300|nr:hypothetical protein [Streptomyces sp. GC420]NBM15067.1 hypothetical protein [Streptomyces sp. GC420]
MSFGQGGPSWGPGGGQGPQGPFDSYGSSGARDSSTPDWAALADASARRNRRRKLLMVGGCVAATVAVGTLVATAVVRSNDKDGDRTSNAASELPGPEDLPSGSAEPEPSFSSVSPPPPPDPEDFISSADKDKAPLTPGSLYPGNKLTMGDRVYKKGTITRATNCASATQGGLGALFTKNGCTQVIRATYTKDGVAVTVGVAVFDTAAKASTTKAQWDDGNIASLPGSGVKTFCRTTVCRKTGNSYGRYAYFTIAGFTNGKDVAKADKKVFQAGDDLAEFTFRQIHRRGEAQASAAAAGGQ